MRLQKKLVLIMSLLLVLTSAFLPVMAKEMVNMEFKQAPLVDVFQILGELGGYNVLVDQSVSGEITFSLKNLAVEEALDLVTRTTGYGYKLVGNTLIIGTEQRLKSEFDNQDVSFVAVENVDVTSAQRLVSLVVPSVKSHVDQELNLLVLSGLTTDLELAKKVLRQYDQNALGYLPVTTGSQVEAREPVVGEVLLDRTVPVFYGEGLEILEVVRQRWPLREFRWEEKTQNIAGLTTAEEWATVQALVQAKDVPNFIVKGLLGNADGSMALVEYKRVTTLLKLGDVLQDWQVTAIKKDGVVEFSQGQRNFTVRMGR